MDPKTPQPLNAVPEPQIGMSLGSSLPGTGTPPPPPAAGSGLPPELSAVPDGKSGGSKKMMIVIALIVVILLGIGGYYFYSTMMNQPGETPETDTQSDADLTGLETELEQIQVTDPDGDLLEVDKEITLLEATPSAR